MHFSNKSLHHIATIASTLLLSSSMTACNSARTETRSPSPFKPGATLQEVMTAIIDPNIDFIWNSVSLVSTANGTVEHRPQTDEDWKVLRQHALAVAEAGNLLLIEDRPIAATNANTSSGGAELNPTDIRILIAANRNEYVNRVHGLQTAAQGLIAAIDAQNVEELEKAGGEVEQACELCHTQFWYPGDIRPK
ncbi:MAG: cytochrome c [Methylomonas sp.]